MKYFKAKRTGMFATYLCILLVLSSIPSQVFALQFGKEYEFQMAIIDGPVEKVKKMLEEGFDPNKTRPGTPVTYLMTAANQGNTEIVQLLLDYGADPTVKLLDGSTALTFAASQGELETVKLLLNVDPAPIAEQLNQALLASAGDGHPLTSTTLVKTGADVDTQGSGGLTPLHLAAKGGFPKTTRTLIGLGADINQTDSLGRTPLMTAAWSAKDAAVEVLLARGADTGIRDYYGYKAFYGLHPGESWQELLKRHWTKIPVSTDSCEIVVGWVSLFQPEGSDTLNISGYQLYNKPKAGSEAWMIDYERKKPVKRTIESVKPNQFAATELGKKAWDIQLKGIRKGDLDNPQSSGLIIWPAVDTVSVIDEPKRENLPWGLQPEVIRLAVDLDGDNKADVLDIEFCCKDPFSAKQCEYYCTQYWIKTNGRWIKCQENKPA